MGKRLMIDCMPITDAKIAAIRDLISALGPMSTIRNFEELIQTDSIRAMTRLWWSDSGLAAFAYVDDYSNLWFDINPALESDSLAAEVFAWGIESIRDGSTFILNSCSLSSNLERKHLLENNGFIRQSGFTLNYSRDLTGAIEPPPLPPGFHCRAVRGESEAQQMVDLQHAAFETEYMTLDTRLTQMRAPGYCPALDLVIESPDGRLAAFCFCTLDRAGKQKTGFTEPIGTHPDFRNHGLARAILTTALNILCEMGCQYARLSTSMENFAMQHLAASLGFIPDNDLIWYSKATSLDIS